MDTSLSELQAWTGRSETWRDQVGATPVKALNATLDHPAMPADSGTPLPPLWHWLYFLPLHRQSEIGPDGHAKRGGFLPPVPLPRRMWAGSQFEFRSPLRVGDSVERTSTIADVSGKEGRTGKLVFVKVRHEVRCNGASDPAIVEFHDIVYRDAKRPGDVEPPPQRAETGAAWVERVARTYPACVWLNPVAEKEWDYTQSIRIMRQLMGGRMYPLTLEGLDKAMRELVR